MTGRSRRKCPKIKYKRKNLNKIENEGDAKTTTPRAELNVIVFSTDFMYVKTFCTLNRSSWAMKERSRSEIQLDLINRSNGNDKTTKILLRNNALVAIRGKTV